jgi:hypothetical protein
MVVVLAPRLTARSGAAGRATGASQKAADRAKHRSRFRRPVRDNGGVTLDIDSSTPIRSLARYRELVIAVHEAPASEQETNSVEWKGEADLAEKRWQAQMGRQILGMANRDPEVADNMLGGCGYIVVGVSPGELLGTQVHDTAKIESWISPYVGQPPNAPEWAPTYVEIRGRQVLVLTVEPPRYGHPAWPCRKGYSPDPRKPGADPKLADWRRIAAPRTGQQGRRHRPGSGLGRGLGGAGARGTPAADPADAGGA